MDEMISNRGFEHGDSLGHNQASQAVRTERASRNTNSGE
jgi:hypothetical protein